MEKDNVVLSLTNGILYFLPCLGFWVIGFWRELNESIDRYYGGVEGSRRGECENECESEYEYGYGYDWECECECVGTGIGVGI